MLISRSDRGLLASWWFTTDRMLMTAVFLLMAGGVLISMAASPPVAERIGLDPFHFFRNQLVYVFPAMAVLAGVSFLDTKQVRRWSMWVLLASLALMVLALFFGPEIKGAHRWLDIGPVNLQPSELAKPAFVVIAAWLLGEHTRQPHMPGHILAFILAGIFIGLLILQPDFGQTALMTAVFAAMLLIYGIPWALVFGLLALCALGVFAAYEMVPHVASRIDRFLDPEKGDNFQIETAIEAFGNGGLVGTGPGGGVAKHILPDSHTDFPFAVVGEELGLVACIVLMALFAFIVMRVLKRAMDEPEPFPALAMSGLVIVFGLQAVINMGVNVALLPAKGMTLPFISYGGSSLIGMAFAMGLVLALGRKRPVSGGLADGMTEHKPGTVVLAAGGTGGHLFPAQALAEELSRRGHIIHLMTDERVKDYGKAFPAVQIHEVPSATLSLSQPLLLPGRLLRLWGGYRKAKGVLEKLKPVAVAGFGGYPSFPPLLAAWRLKIPSVVHDQNAVMGRANRVLARVATAVASSFPELSNLPGSAGAKMTVTGNPVRDLALKEKASPYKAPAASEKFELLVFGGSQGAKFFSDFMPNVFKALPPVVVKSIHLVQQCRPEDIDATRQAYASLGVNCELQPFFTDMPKRIAAAHLVLCRSGASTIAELGVIGRPAVMVPLPHAIDNDQLRNAESFVKAGAGWVMPQATLKADEFAAFLARLRYQEAELNQAARAALAHGRPEAAKLLADLVEKLSKERPQ